jgi:hypothetical protein
MENLDIIILNIFVIICFIAFFVSTFNAFESATKLDKNKFEKRGIISRFLAYLGSIVN